MKQRVLSGLLVIFSVAAISFSVYAVPTRLIAFTALYGTAGTGLDTCLVCHAVPDPSVLNGAPRNLYGDALFNSGYDFAAVEPFDSDGDGFSNITEITARTFPGDPNSRPTPLDAVPPTVTSFTLPATFTIPDTSTTLTVPVTAFTAVDDAGGSGIAGFMITESAVVPVSSDPRWTPVPPVDYTPANLGLTTLFGWAKDAAGNVSTGLSATVTTSLSAGRRFLDVPVTQFNQIDLIAAAGITAGCRTNPPLFCPDSPISRGQMAVFIETSLARAIGACTGRFSDVPIGHPFCGFVERLATDGITGGCAAGPPARFCPDDPVTRAQMAVFVETALGGVIGGACAGTFADVPVAHPLCGFVERLAADGITAGCTAGPPARFCPDDPVTRAQMAVFLVTAPLPLAP
jgi:hypothetical protein